LGGFVFVCGFIVENISHAFFQAGVELFKIHFSVGEFSFYKTFNKNNLERELAAFELELSERHERIFQRLRSEKNFDEIVKKTSDYDD
jgi:hypothetical protein